MNVNDGDFIQCSFNKGLSNQCVLEAEVGKSLCNEHLKDNVEIKAGAESDIPGLRMSLKFNKDIFLPIMKTLTHKLFVSIENNIINIKISKKDPDETLSYESPYSVNVSKKDSGEMKSCMSLGKNDKMFGSKIIESGIAQDCEIELDLITLAKIIGNLFDFEKFINQFHNFLAFCVCRTKHKTKTLKDKNKIPIFHPDRFFLPDRVSKAIIYITMNCVLAEMNGDRDELSPADLRSISETYTEAARDSSDKCQVGHDFMDIHEFLMQRCLYCVERYSESDYVSTTHIMNVMMNSNKINPNSEEYRNFMCEVDKIFNRKGRTSTVAGRARDTFASPVRFT
jgi:hypothetical protein